MFIRHVRVTTNVASDKGLEIINRKESPCNASWPIYMIPVSGLATEFLRKFAVRFLRYLLLSFAVEQLTCNTEISTARKSGNIS